MIKPSATLSTASPCAAAIALKRLGPPGKSNEMIALRGFTDLRPQFWTPGRFCRRVRIACHSLEARKLRGNLDVADFSAEVTCIGGGGCTSLGLHEGIACQFPALLYRLERKPGCRFHLRFVTNVFGFHLTLQRKALAHRCPLISVSSPRCPRRQPQPQAQLVWCGTGF